jgi:hypothetical protein
MKKTKKSYKKKGNISIKNIIWWLFSGILIIAGFYISYMFTVWQKNPGVVLTNFNYIYVVISIVFIIILFYCAWKLYQDNKSLSKRYQEYVPNINIFKNSENKYSIILILTNLIVSLIITLGCLFNYYIYIRGLNVSSQYSSFLDIVLNISNVLIFLIIFLMWSYFRKNSLKV